MCTVEADRVEEEAQWSRQLRALAYELREERARLVRSRPDVAPRNDWKVVNQLLLGSALGLPAEHLDDPDCPLVPHTQITYVLYCILVYRISTEIVYCHRVLRLTYR